MLIIVEGIIAMAALIGLIIAVITAIRMKPLPDGDAVAPGQKVVLLPPASKAWVFSVMTVMAAFAFPPVLLIAPVLGWFKCRKAKEQALESDAGPLAAWGNYTLLCLCGGGLGDEDENTYYKIGKDSRSRLFRGGVWTEEKSARQVRPRRVRPARSGAGGDGSAGSRRVLGFLPYDPDELRDPNGDLHDSGSPSRDSSDDSHSPNGDLHDSDSPSRSSGRSSRDSDSPSHDSSDESRSSGRSSRGSGSSSHDSSDDSHSSDRSSNESSSPSPSSSDD